MKLPALLKGSRRGDALDALACYYGRGTHANHTFTGAYFDTWDSLGTRLADADRFTADDLAAVTFLSVNVPPTAARQLLVTQADEFSRLLTAVGPDRDLAREAAPWPEDWAGWALWKALIDLPGVGPTTASKLFARKRPQLRPIYDTVIARVIGSTSIWEPLRAHLRANPHLHEQLIGLRDEVDLPSEISALRVFDVLAWMEGKGNVPCVHA